MTLPASISPDELARYAVALANTRGGQMRVRATQGHGHLHPLEITHAIFALSGGKLTVNAWQEQPGGDLLIQVPQAPYVLAAPDGSVNAWDGQGFIPVSPPERMQAQQDYTATVLEASLADLDPLEVARLRAIAQGELTHLADLDFLRELGLVTETRTPAGQELRPTVAGLLLAGTERALRTYLPQAEVCYYYRASADVEFQFREDLRRPLTSALSRLSDLIQARNSFTPVQVGLFRIEVWDQDEAVYREALLNALTHRDYQLRDVVHVHHYPDRLEIMNPGGLSGGVTTANILRHQPKRRNPLLAEALARLGLVERAGVGVDKMYALMLRHGKEPPKYLTYPDAVTLSLHNPGFNAAFVRFVARKQEEMQTLSLDMLIVLSLLGREGEATRAQLARALQLPEERTPRLLRAMEERGLIVSERVGKERINRLSAETLSVLSGAATAPPTPPTLPSPSPSRQHCEETALRLAKGGVRNRDLREACGISSKAAWRLLCRLTKAGLLRREGTRGQSRYYAL